MPDASFMVGGLCGALIGAAIAIWRSRYSAKSTDLTKRLETVTSIIDALADSASRARTQLGAEKDGLISSKSYCVALQARLEDAIGRLNKDYGKFSDEGLTRAFVEFTKACTGGKFDESCAQPEVEIRQILISGGRLKDALAQARMKHY